MEPEHKFDQNSKIILHTGRKIPIIGYGTYQLKGEDCVNGVQHALQNDYIHIDTASIYKNQEQIRKALEEMKIPRENLFITSKISPAQQGFKESKEACANIIQKLGCQYLDLLLIHWPGVSKMKVQSKDNATIRLQTWKAFIEMQKQGKVRDIGVSNFLKKHLEHLLKNTDVKPVINQFEIHPLLWQKQTIEFCRQKNIAIQAYSPLARQDPKLFKNQKMLALAKKYSKSIAQISLRWCLQNNFIILPKSKTAERIIENINIFDFQLTQAQMKQIMELTSKKVRTCWDPNSIVY